MKSILLVLIFLCSCKTYQSDSTVRENLTNEFVCPDDGKCSFEVIKNISFQTQKDSLGFLYPKITEGENILLKFKYTRNIIPDTADSSYIEEIYFDVSPQKLELILADQELKETVLFARLCFCRGQTGYYKIKKGNLIIKKLSENIYNLRFDFTIDEVPQVISIIDYSFSIE